MTIENIREILEKEGIGYHKTVAPDGTVFLYIDHGNFGYPADRRLRKIGFRPDFRLSVHEDHPNKVYARICGVVGYMTMDEVLETIRGAA